MKKEKSKLFLRVTCFLMAALMVVGMAYMTIYLILSMI